LSARAQTSMRATRLANPMTKETTYATMLIPMHERTVAKLFSLRA